MLPVTDFNFMVAGIATFAATVGYTYAARKLHTTTTGDGLSDDPRTIGTSDAMQQTNTTSDGGQVEFSGAPSRRESTSLKRKEPHDGFEDENTQDVGYPHNLANIYPRKRCRTPTHIKQEVLNIIQPLTPVPSDFEVTKKSERELTNGDSPTQEDWVFIPPFNSFNSPNALPIVEPPRTPTPELETLITPTPSQEIVNSPQISPVPVPTEPQPDNLESESVLAEPETKESTTKGSDKNSTTSDHSLLDTENTNTPKSSVEVTKATPKDTRNVMIKAPFVPVPSPSRSMPSSSAFKSRGFAEFAGTKSAFGVFSATQAVTHKNNQSIWSTSSVNQTQESNFSDSTSNALSQTTPLKKATVTQLTGEEEEDVEMELKGVKLYVKRGEKPFAEGMTGHVKLLSHKTTLDERLLFRREPLWKVSMNVWVNSSVRCTFDSSENVLRLIVSEHSDSTDGVEGQESPVEIVLYAMKPGRSCSKQDFKEFAETLIKNSRFKKPLSASS